MGRNIFDLNIPIAQHQTDQLPYEARVDLKEVAAKVSETELKQVELNMRLKNSLSEYYSNLPTQSVAALQTIDFNSMVIRPPRQLSAE